MAKQHEQSQRLVIALLILVVLVSLVSFVLYLNAAQRIEQLPDTAPKLVVNGGRAYGEVAIIINAAEESVEGLPDELDESAVETVSNTEIITETIPETSNSAINNKEAS